MTRVIAQVSRGHNRDGLTRRPCQTIALRLHSHDTVQLLDATAKVKRWRVFDADTPALAGTSLG